MPALGMDSFKARRDRAIKGGACGPGSMTSLENLANLANLAGRNRAGLLGSTLHLMLPQRSTFNPWNGGSNRPELDV